METARDALIQEARELLDIMEQTLARVVAAGEDSDAVNEIFRVAHTIKGSASLFSFEHLISFTHLLESMLEHVRSETLSLDSPMVDLLVECGDYISELVDAIAAGREQTDPDPVRRSRLEAAITRVLAPTRLHDLVPATPAQSAVTSIARPPEPAAGQPRARPAYVKVSVSRLDALIDLVGELVISRASIEEVARQEKNPRLEAAARNMTDRVAELREVALMLRMVPIGGVFQRLPRVVRRVAGELGKTVHVEAYGGDTELDRSMIEKLYDPLLHIVRNAVDHGIEPPAERLAIGKPAAGTITLRARHESGSVVIEVSDDGRGLDPERIRQRAVQDGRLDPTAPFTERELDRLLFEPGFSTAERVTRVSGRGVGMDIVRKQVEGLRGEVAFISEPGQGATIRMRLPLTLAIIDGFLARVGESTFVLPLDSVLECVDINECVMYTQAAELRGERLPCLRLADLFGLAPGTASRQNLVIVENGRRQRVGLVVDSLVGEFQAVIRPLGCLFEKLGAFSGSTILPDGRVALILDVPQLVQRALGACPAAAGEVSDV